MPNFQFTSPDGKNYSVQGPDGSTPEQAFKILQTQIGGPAAADQPSGLEDAGKSVASGLASMTASTLGAAGDARSLLSSATDWAGGKLGASPGAVQSFKDYAAKAANLTPTGAVLANAPTTRQVIDSSDPIVSPDYEPKTGLGGVLKTGAEFLPSMVDPELAGPKVLGTAAKLFATRVAAPALTSEAAGALTKGTAAEPYAKIAAALVGAGGASMAERKLAAATAARASGAAIPAVDDLKAAARAQYQHPDVQAVQIKPNVVSDLADTISTDLQHGPNSGFRPANEAKVFSAVDELKNAAAQGRPATVADLDSVRQVLGNAGKEKDITGSLTRQAVAANRAIDHIDNFLPSLKQPDLIAGDAAKANSILGEARQNWGAAKRAQNVQTVASNAEINAASSHSGANIQNATKQAFKPLLKNNYAKAGGYNDAEKAALNSIVRGTWTGNAARAAGNLLGGGGGLGMLAGGAAGYEAGGLPGALAGAAAGRGLKMIGNRSTFNAVQKLDGLIRSRSPEALRIVAQNPQLAASLPPKSIPLLRTMILSEPMFQADNQKRQAVGQSSTD